MPTEENDEDYEDDYDNDLDLDYTVTDLTDEEIDEKMTDLMWKMDPMEEALGEMHAEHDMLQDEKNRRFNKKNKND